MFLLSNYEELLDRAFAKLPTLSEEKVDFKIPDAESLIQGSKTIVKNFGFIVGVARRTNDEIAKYLTKELAAPVSIEDQKLVINAKIPSATLNTKVKKYFETYIICKECHKPDTHVGGAERGYLTIVCEACGARYTVKHY